MPLLACPQLEYFTGQQWESSGLSLQKVPQFPHAYCNTDFLARPPMCTLDGECQVMP